MLLENETLKHSDDDRGNFMKCVINRGFKDMKLLKMNFGPETIFIYFLYQHWV